MHIRPKQLLPRRLASRQSTVDVESSRSGPAPARRRFDEGAVDMSEHTAEPRLIALLMCEAIQLETDGHKTPLHMMSRLMLDRVPSVRSLTIFARYLMPPGPHRVDVEFVDPHGNQIWTPEAFPSVVN